MQEAKARCPDRMAGARHPWPAALPVLRDLFALLCLNQRTAKEITQVQDAQSGLGDRRSIRKWCARSRAAARFPARSAAVRLDRAGHADKPSLSRCRTERR